MQTNYHRLIRLAEETFDARNDPEQLSMTEEDRARLLALHPATLSQEADEHGPVAWMLLFPTTHALMERFLREDIGEVQLLHETPLDERYEAIYICSALVLEEYRRQGIALRLAVEAIRRIMADHPIRSLFIWAFTEEGDRLANAIAAATGLPLYKRKKREHP